MPILECVDNSAFQDSEPRGLLPGGDNLSKNRYREPSGLAEHLLWYRRQRVSVDLVMQNRRTLSLVPQTVATTWCAGESQRRHHRAYLVSLRAICAIPPSPPGSQTPEEQLHHSTFSQALLTLVRVGRPVSVLIAGCELGGVVQRVDTQGLVITRPHSLRPGEESWMIPLDQVLGVALLEPGDSFPPPPRAVVSLGRGSVEGAWW